MKRIFLISLLCFWVLGLSDAQAEEVGILNQTGLTKLVNDNRGKVILVNLFATWCPPCKVEIPELVKIRQDFSQSELLIIGLSVDEETGEILPFTEKNGVNYPVYKADKSITDHFDISSVPHNIFFAKNGRMVISEPGIADSEILQQVIDDLLEDK